MIMGNTSTIDSKGQLLTNDGVPLKQSLRKSLRRTKIRSFLLILVSQFFSVFVFLWNELYVLGELFMLIGFLLLLFTYRKITKITY